MFCKSNLLMMAVALIGATAMPAQAQFEGSREFPEALQTQVFQTVVRIRVKTDKGVSQGSGVCIDYHNGVATILTAAHVVKGAKSMTFEVFTRSSYPRPARTSTPSWKLQASHGDDIAVIWVKMWVPLTARLAKDPAAIRADEHVLSFGCGKGAPPTAQVGRLAGFRVAGDWAVERGAIGGRSGGPLFSRHGVIGIVSRGRDGLTLFVGLEKIHDLLRRAAGGTR